MSRSLDILATRAELEVVNRRGLIIRHHELAAQRKWNAELIPSEEQSLSELEDIAATIRGIANSPRAQAALMQAWEDDEAEMATRG